MLIDLFLFKTKQDDEDENVEAQEYEIMSSPMQRLEVIQCWTLYNFLFYLFLFIVRTLSSCE